MGFNVAALADFNNEVAGKIVLQTVYKGNTAEYVSIQEGIKYQEPLNKIAILEPPLSFDFIFSIIVNKNSNAPSFVGVIVISFLFDDFVAPAE